MVQSAFRGRSRVQVEDGFLRLLRKFPPEMQKKILPPANRSGAQVLRQAAIGNIGGGSKDHIRVVKARRARAGVARHFVGVAREHWPLSFKELGVDPHTITPKNSRLLRFMIGGDVVFAPQVQHPGVQQEPFLRPAFDTDGERAIAKIGELLEKGMIKQGNKLVGKFSKSGLGRRRRRRR